MTYNVGLDCKARRSILKFRSRIKNALANVNAFAQLELVAVSFTREAALRHMRENVEFETEFWVEIGNVRRHKYGDWDTSCSITELSLCSHIEQEMKDLFLVYIFFCSILLDRDRAS